MKKKSLYNLLEPYGISPKSTMKEIDSCDFKIMKAKSVDSVEAKNELNAVKSLKNAVLRMSEDFFHLENNPLCNEKQDLEALKFNHTRFLTPVQNIGSFIHKTDE